VGNPTLATGETPNAGEIKEMRGDTSKFSSIENSIFV